MKFELVVVVLFLAGYAAAQETVVIEESINHDSIEPRGDTKCTICEFVMKHVQYELKDDRTDEAIKRTVLKICNVVPTSTAKLCNAFINQNADAIIQLLIRKTDPSKVCQMLHLCQASEVEDTIVIAESIKDESIEPRGNTKCAICEFVMKHVQYELKDDRTDEAIRRTVLKICNVVPTSAAKVCNDFINQHADSVIQLLIRKTDPSKVCQMLHLCQAPEVEANVLECAVCEGVSWAMKKLLDDPNIDHKIDNVLGKTCHIIPAKNQQKCKEIIEKYGHYIYDLLIHYVKETEVCKKIKLC